MLIAGIHCDTCYNGLQCRTFHYYTDGHTSMLCHHSPMGPKLKRRKALIWVSLVWLIAFTLTIPIIIVKKPTQNGNCREVWPSKSLSQAYTTTLMSVQFFIPLIITAICYIKIWLFLRRRPVFPQRRLRTGESTAPEETSRESVVILKTVAVIVVSFLVFLLPTQVAWMLFDFKLVSINTAYKTA